MRFLFYYKEILTALNLKICYTICIKKQLIHYNANIVILTEVILRFKEDIIMKSTPHINQTAEIAETILLPGDPLRAKYIAENYLDNVTQFNSVRGALGFTGTYKGNDISVMGTGMGMPSMGIYSYELINVFGVKNLIRIGSCGSIQPEINIFDIIFGLATSTDSNFAFQFNLPGNYSACCSYALLAKAKNRADELGFKNHVGNILSSDVFYSDDTTINSKWKKMGIMAVEMEAAALYMHAARYGANALCMLTVSDNILTGESLNAQQRQEAFENMITTALSLA